MVTDEELVAHFERLYLKTTEILSMMKRGEFIIAYEKLSGVQKIIFTLGGELQQRGKNDTKDT